MTTRTKKLLEKHAEVTKGGIKARGSPANATQKTVVVNETTTGRLKKQLLFAGSTLMAATIAVGLMMDWTSDMVHVAYPVGSLYIAQMLTILFTKME